MGCGPTSQSTTPVAPVTSAASPLAVVIFDDKSSSVQSGRMVPLTENDVQAGLDLVKTTGGVLALGFIGETSDRPLLRVSLAPPPMAPPPPDAANPFQRRAQEETYRQQWSLYAARRQEWEADTNRQVEMFLVAARPRLQAPATQRATGIHEALARAALLLNEPALQSGRRFILLNTDGLATTPHAPVNLPPGTRLLLCNGTGSTGALAVYASAVQRFEAVRPALDELRSATPPTQAQPTAPASAQGGTPPR